ncbi:MAG: SDR family oxidoreductase [Verrucomicrobiota bacterium]
MTPLTIFITGANRGIGLGLSQRFLEEGHHVISTYRAKSDTTELFNLAKKYHTLKTVLLDITNQESIENVLPNIRSVDILINNAAIFSRSDRANTPFQKLSIDTFSDVFKTNLEGTARVTQALLPNLRLSHRPVIINISSGAGSISVKDNNFYYCYSVSKAGLNMLTRALSSELIKMNITTVAFSPGWVQTEMGGDDAEISVEECSRTLAKSILSITSEDNGRFYGRLGRSDPYPW